MVFYLAYGFPLSFAVVSIQLLYSSDGACAALHVVHVQCPSCGTPMTVTAKSRPVVTFKTLIQHYQQLLKSLDLVPHREPPPPTGKYLFAFSVALLVRCLY